MAVRLTPRLAAVALCVRQGAFLADIGTDHAYLPIALTEAGRLCGAVASDIRRGPLAHAGENICAAGLSDKIETRLADGLFGMESLPLTDIVIAGMGGQMIAGILSAAPFVREKKPYLILQPMQNIEELREYLSHGYQIVREELAAEGDKLYQVICAEYDGAEHLLSPVEMALGTWNIMRKKENAMLFGALCRRKMTVLSERIRGLTAGGCDITAEKALYAQIMAEYTELAEEKTDGDCI